MSKYLEFAEVRRSKENPDETYIVFTVDMEVKAKNYKGEVVEYSFKKGDSIYKDSPQDKLQSLVENGHLSEDKAEERASKIPEFILQILTARQKN